MDLVRFDRLEQLIKAQGRTKTYICDKAGKKRNYISNAQNGNGSISDEALAVFARELGTTVDYLKGESDEETPAVPGGLSEEDRRALEVVRGASPEELEIVERIRKASPDQQKAILTLLGREKG